MTDIKLEVGKTYELNNGEVHKCTRMRGDDPLAEVVRGYGPFLIDGCLYHQDGRFADKGSDDLHSVKRCIEETHDEWDGVGPITDANVKVQTRDGREVRLAGINPDASDYDKIIGWVNINGNWIVRSWNMQGHWMETAETGLDLIPVPKTVTHDLWVNLYPEGTIGVHTTEKDALNYARSPSIETRKITWETEA